MKITRTSTLTGKEHTRDIDVTEAQLALWKNGTLTQEAMPGLSVDDREFLKTGITPEEWTEHFDAEYEADMDELRDE